MPGDPLWRILTLKEYVDGLIGHLKGSTSHTYTNIEDNKRKLNIALGLPNLGYRKTINRKLRSIESLPFIPQSIILYKAKFELDSIWLEVNCGGGYRHDPHKGRIFLESEGDAATFTLCHINQK